jgi:endoglucanase
MKTRPNRRDFLKRASAIAAAGLLPATVLRGAESLVALKKLPRWRGFNLLEKFIAQVANKPFREEDFAWIAEWGFNFVRLPMSYHCWSDAKNWRELREPILKEIDAAVELGRQYGVHVNLNFHRAPGYSVDAATAEPFNLWTDAEALEACALHWRHFAQRYRDVPGSALSFNLVNEPATQSPASKVWVGDAAYARVVQTLVAAIRAESPGRLIFADGLVWGRVPVPALADLGISQSLHVYDPMPVTHWHAGWVEGSDQWPQPTWPLAVSADAAAADRAFAAGFREAFHDNPIAIRSFDRIDYGAEWNRARLDRQVFQPWRELAALGVPVHIGEFGAFNRTPYPVVMAWMGDFLGLSKSAGWGWALWNFRGEFGVLDSQRADVKYENFRGHQLDRQMLELLQTS